MLQSFIFHFPLSYCGHPHRETFIHTFWVGIAFPQNQGKHECAMGRHKSRTFSWFQNVLSKPNQTNLAEGFSHRRWALSFSQLAVPWLSNHPLQWPRSRQMSLDECPGLFGMTSQRKGSRKSGNYFPRTATSSPWLPVSRVIIGRMAGQVLPHPLSCACPLTVAPILTGTFFPWRTGRRGFSSCCCCVQEPWAAGVSWASAEWHWTSLRCYLLLWSRTSVNNKAQV